MRSSQQEPEISGMKSTHTNEPEVADTPHSEALVEELESLESESGPPGPLPPSARRFVMIVTGTVPGKDQLAERDLVLKTMERAMGGLVVTDGIELISAAYRSDPTNPPAPSEATVTAPDAPDTDESSEADGESSDEESPDGSSDGSPSTSEDSGSNSANTSP